MCSSGKRARYINVSCHDNLNIVVVLSRVASYCYAFLTFCVRSVCAFVRVCLCTHVSQGGITFVLVIISFVKV